MLLAANQLYYKSYYSNKCEEELNNNSKIKKYYKYIKNKYKTDKQQEGLNLDLQNKDNNNNKNKKDNKNNNSKDSKDSGSKKDQK